MELHVCDFMHSRQCRKHKINTMLDAHVLGEEGKGILHKNTERKIYFL